MLSLYVACATAPPARVEGVEIVDLVGSDGHDCTVGIRRAIRLVASVSPAHLKRLQKMKRILVGPSFKGVSFMSSPSFCAVEADYIAGRPLEVIASYLIHEATHAKLFSLGFGYDAAIRPRIERACLRSELRFALRLGNPALVEHVERRLLARHWETDQELFDRREEEYQRTRTPNWILALRRVLLRPPSQD